MLSTLPFAAVTEMALKAGFAKNHALVRAPTTNATPVIMKMKTPPPSTARLSSRSLRTVMKRTTSWGCASTPIPTPRTMVETSCHQ